MKYRFGFLALVVPLVMVNPAVAAPPDEAQEVLQTDDPTPYSDKLLGDLYGKRSELAHQGIEINLNYAGDVWAVVNGGKKRNVTYLDFIELRTNLDGEKLFGIQGNTISVSLTDSNGTKTNASSVGSVQGIDNSEVNANGVRLYEAWMQQNFFDDRLSFLLGLHDLNTEFASTPISDNFLVPTFQLGQSFAQSGVNGPSVFPTTSLSGRVKVKPSEESYLSAAVYDGVPGDPNRTSGSAIRFGEKDGLLLVTEAGLIPKAADSDAEVNKLAIGFWNYTAKLPDIETGDSENPRGMYILSSYRFYHDKAKSHDLGVFARGGFSNGDTSQIDWDYEAGIVANGLMPSRPDSEIGLGISAAHNSHAYLTSIADAADHVETSYELYYRDTIWRGINIQPDIIYVNNPGTDQTTKDAFIIGARLGVEF